MNPSDEHSDSVFYGAAVEEIQSGIIDKGLMGKAIAKSKGNRKEAEALYLEWRVALLKEETIAEARRRQEHEKAKKNLTRLKEEKFSNVLFVATMIILFALFFLLQIY